MNSKNIYNLAFMPYAPLKETRKLGNFELWPFYEEAEHKINDSNIISQLNKYFSRFFEFKYDRHRGGYDKIIDTIYIVNPETFKIGIDQLTEKEINDIRSISHIISFSSIFESGFGTITSDPFTLIFQRFAEGEEGLTVWHKSYLNFELFKILKPIYINSTLFPFRKTKLCDVLANSLELRDSNIVINRIFRALELLFHTITFAEMITNNHRLLTLVMAFEVLLNFENKKDFVELIEKYIIDHNSKISSRIVSTADGKRIEEKKSKTCWWAYDLYNLRSQIIHGEIADWKISDYGDIWIRIKFAGNLFKRIFKELLKEQSLWEKNEFDEMTELYSMDESLEGIMNEFYEMNPDLLNNSSR